MRGDHNKLKSMDASASILLEVAVSTHAQSLLLGKGARLVMAYMSDVCYGCNMNQEVVFSTAIAPLPNCLRVIQLSFVLIRY
jgi:hypothetical protein